MFKTILAAYDGSDGADVALQKATGLAKLCGADLIVLTVYQHHSFLEASLSMVGGGDGGNKSLDDVMRTISRDAAEKAKGIAANLGVENVTAFIKRGPASRTIVSFAKEHDCDLIVVGSRGMGSSEGYMLGSVSHKVTSLTDIPVLVV